MITINDIMLAIVLLGPKPNWWRFVQRAKWRRGLRIIEEAGKAYERQQRVNFATIKKDPTSTPWPRLVADEKDVN